MTAITESADLKLQIKKEGKMKVSNYEITRTGCGMNL